MTKTDGRLPRSMWDRVRGPEGPTAVAAVVRQRPAGLVLVRRHFH